MRSPGGAILLTVNQPLLRQKLETVAPLFDLAAMEDPAARATVRVYVTNGVVAPDKALLDALPALGLLAVSAAGFGGIDLQDARSRGLYVTNVQAVNHEDVADAAIGMMIALARGLVAGERQLRAGKWMMGRIAPVRSLRKRRVGVIGMGAIGQAIARRAEVFGGPVAWWGPRNKPHLPWQRAASLLDLARDSDTLFVSALASPETRHLVDGAVLDALGPDGIVVNVARGSLIDEDALLARIVEERIGGAALDVFETEPTPPDRWPQSDRLLLTPHLAGVTHESMDGMFSRVAEIVADFLRGRMPTDPICAP